MKYVDIYQTENDSRYDFVFDFFIQVLYVIHYIISTIKFDFLLGRLCW